jgi:lysozyme
VSAVRRAGLAIVLTLVLATSLWLFARGWHPSDSEFPTQGIDVSHHQGRIQWPLLKAQGVDFAYIKASEGGDLRDPLYVANLKGAAESGIPRGAYHFFTLCRSGADQAANLIAVVPSDPSLLPPAVDLEFGGNCSARPSRAALLRELRVFLDRVEAHSGKPALLYLTEEFDSFYRISEAVDRPLWLRSLVRRPEYGARPWLIWQASNFRRLRGIEGRVDWNVARP